MRLTLLLLAAIAASTAGASSTIPPAIAAAGHRSLVAYEPGSGLIAVIATADSRVVKQQTPIEILFNVVFDAEAGVYRGAGRQHDGRIVLWSIDEDGKNFGTTVPTLTSLERLALDGKGRLLAGEAQTDRAIDVASGGVRLLPGAKSGVEMWVTGDPVLSPLRAWVAGSEGAMQLQLPYSHQGEMNWLAARLEDRWFIVDPLHGAARVSQDGKEWAPYACSPTRVPLDIRSSGTTVYLFGCLGPCEKKRALWRAEDGGWKLFAELPADFDSFVISPRGELWVTGSAWPGKNPTIVYAPVTSDGLGTIHRLPWP
jgi:hypothetical protein